MLAGWLFADLLLVLALVSMADRPDPLAARPKPSKSADASAKPKPKPTGPRSVERRPEEFKVKGTDKDALTDQIGRSTKKWRGRTAALVLTFGGGRNGTVYAHRVNSLLGAGRPEMFTKKTATDDFHDLSSDASTAVVRVYFFTAPGG
ncbi:hypothetical protein STRAU_1420 [Streptomyces aurantiacus JA 4570]|uniref:Uncharacterized protein n=1 Tax=Streptomyces aurantiacus JA 4570 TaxID=1286094 RepID=S4A490_9ACTN|nr:hypothetical protein STRAU_1420 [Streptomyces aurantiacus JA 4570]